MKIITVGAGHGGLIAAAKLAKAGHDVSVFEKNKRENLGYDWEDRFTFDTVLNQLGIKEFDADTWRYRGDCAFVSPDYNTKVVIKYTDANRQKIMLRRPLINLLINNAEKCGVKFFFETEVESAVCDNERVTGIKTDSDIYLADLVIDSSGVFSKIRQSLPDSFNIEKMPERGDVFYAYRAYFDNKDGFNMPEIPFEVYLCHNREQGLSWCCTNDDSTDILIGRIDPIDDGLIKKHIDKFKESHPWIGDSVVSGGICAVIPVRRPLDIMVAGGYAAAGDSAFMTTPMNGMGIDLSVSAGALLADTVIRNNNSSIESLWEYNRDYHRLYGAVTSKNESLKNSLLNLPGDGVDFLFANAIVQAADLSGAGSNTGLGTLLGKFVRGMKSPKYFFSVLGGIMNGSKLAKAYKNVPETYEREKVLLWQKKVRGNVLKVTRQK